MILDSPRLENTTILTGSFEITGTVEPGTSILYDLGTSSKRWRTLHASSLTGSLTKLASGADYLVAGSGIQLSTGSSGAVTITSTVAGASLVAGSNTQVQFNDGGTFGANSGLTYNKTTGAVTGTYVVASTGFSGSLTKLSTGADYLVGGSGITISTGSNGSVTMSLGALSYATASFTNATSVTVNHSVGTTIYDIEVFDTSYNKILPGSATATSPTQSNLTFAIPTSGFVAVGGPTAGSQGASVYAPLLTGSAYLAATTTVTVAASPVTAVTFTLPSAGSWDVTYFANIDVDAGETGYIALYDSGGNKVTNSEVMAAYGTARVQTSGTGKIVINTSGPATYTLRVTAEGGTINLINSTQGRTGVVWTSLGNSTVVGGVTTTVGTAPYYGARAWVSFNGTGTVAIRGSANVSSITDNGGNGGLYTVNFTSPIEDTNYNVVTSAEGAGGSGPLICGPVQSGTYTTAGVAIHVMTYTGVDRDSAKVSVAVFR